MGLLVKVAVLVSVQVGVPVCVGLNVEVNVEVCVPVGEFVSVGVGVKDGVVVIVPVGEKVNVTVGVAEKVGLRVIVAVGVKVRVRVGVGGLLLQTIKAGTLATTRGNPAQLAVTLLYCASSLYIFSWPQPLASATPVTLCRYKGP